MNPNTQIFCDMDGVLVDFLAGASSQMNDWLEQAKENPPTEPKRMRSAYRRILRDVGPDYRVSSEDDLRLPGLRNLMFMLIGRNPKKYFAELGTYQDGQELLWPYLNSTGHLVSLLTAGIPDERSDVTAAELGKRIWAARNLQPQPHGFICTLAVRKREYAVSPDGTPNVLIDDKLRTINQWNDDGGYGILHVPGRSDMTIKNLKSLGL